IAARRRAELLRAREGGRDVTCTLHVFAHRREQAEERIGDDGGERDLAALADTLHTELLLEEETGDARLLDLRPRERVDRVQPEVGGEEAEAMLDQDETLIAREDEVLAADEAE